MSKTSKNLVFAAGGTGGHIYPAVALARAALKQDPSLKIHFVGTRSGLETKIIPKEGFELHTISIGRLNNNVSVVERVMTLLKLPFAFLQSIGILLKLKPRFVVGIGGHASGPFLLMSSLLGIKSYIWEPNAYPGLANRILSKYVTAVYVTFEQALSKMKTKVHKKVGFPVRESIERIAFQDKDSQSEKFNVFIFGGSQGSRSLNTHIIEMLSSGESWLSQVRWVHQAGATDYEVVQEQYNQIIEVAKAQGLDLEIECLSFIEDMERRYAEADLAICRCGVGSLFELAASGTPGLLIPLPSAADDHQRKNAEAFVQKKASEMILQKDLSGELLSQRIQHYLNNRNEIDQMAHNIQQFHQPGTAQKIVGELMGSVDA